MANKKSGFRLSGIGIKMLSLGVMLVVIIVLGIVMLTRGCSTNNVERTDLDSVDSVNVEAEMMNTEMLEAALQEEVTDQYDADEVEVASKWHNYLEDLIYEDSSPMLYGLETDRYDITRGVIESGETFSKLLNDKFEVDFGVINELIEKCNGVFDLRDLRAGKPYAAFMREVGSDSAVMDYLVYEKSQFEYIVFGTGGERFVRKGKKDVVTEERYAEGVIESSLYATIYQNDLNPELASKLDMIFKWSVNFFTLQKGDSFKVLYEEQFIDTVSVGVGEVYGAEFTHKGQPILAVRFEQGDELGYWDADGKNLKKNFLTAPLQYSYRVSSRFGTRIHPIKGYRKQHNGIDYAAPTGTPVLAVADGIASVVGWDRSGGGNRIWLKHSGRLETVYMHLSRFAKGVRSGVRVHQGQVIGYVGTTGASTGPHLHYGVKQGGRYINPQNIPSTPTTPILAHSKESFARMKSDVLNVMSEYQN